MAKDKIVSFWIGIEETPDKGDHTETIIDVEYTGSLDFKAVIHEWTKMLQPLVEKHVRGTVKYVTTCR